MNNFDTLNNALYLLGYYSVEQSSADKPHVIRLPRQLNQNIDFVVQEL